VQQNDAALDTAISGNLTQANMSASTQFPNSMLASPNVEFVVTLKYDFLVAATTGLKDLIPLPGTGAVAAEAALAHEHGEANGPFGRVIRRVDALDIDEIIGLHAHFGGTLQGGATARKFRSAADFQDRDKWIPGRRIRFSAGWGTLLTNDFRGCDPKDSSEFDPISLICKVSRVEGRPAVKLSDNYTKALGPASETERYRRVFGTAGMANAPLVA